MLFRLGYSGFTKFHSSSSVSLGDVIGLGRLWLDWLGEFRHMAFSLMPVTAELHMSGNCASMQFLLLPE
jgi:hypothetical protein